MAEINFELLKIFYEVAKEESITRASENLFISQPAVSQSIKKLEGELDGVLFNRSNKGISLTSEGKEFFGYVKEALGLIKRGQDEFVNFKKLERGTIKIGISTTLTKLVLLKPLVQFHRDFPKVKIEIENGLTSSLLDNLMQGKLDMAIYSEDFNNDKLESFPISQFHHCFVYNKNFYNIGNKISLNELAKYPLILQNKKSNTRNMFEKLAEKFKLKNLNYTEVVSQELVKILSECGFGVGFVIEEDEIDESLSVVELEEELPAFEVKLARSANTIPTFAAKKFIEYVLNKK